DAELTLDRAARRLQPGDEQDRLEARRGLDGRDRERQRGTVLEYGDGDRERSRADRSDRGDAAVPERRRHGAGLRQQDRFDGLAVPGARERPGGRDGAADQPLLGGREG